MITEFLTLITIISSFIWYYSENRRFSKGKRLPGPVPLPYIGNALQLIFQAHRRNYEVFEDLCNKYGPIVGLRAGNRDFVLIQDFELAKTVMSLDDWSARLPPEPFVLERTFNKNLGIIWSYGESWKEMRKYNTRIMRQFGFGKGASMETFIEQEALEFLKHLDKIRAENNNIVFIRQIFNIPALNLLWTMMAGIRFPYGDPKFCKLLDSADKMSQAIRPGLTPLAGFAFLRHIPGLTEHDDIMSVTQTVQGLFKEIIDNRRIKGTYLDNPEDFLDVFMKDVDTKKPSDPKAEYYTEEQMISMCVDLFFTSSDTTSSALGFAFAYMILNPNVMAKVKNEIARVIGPDRIPNLDDKNMMPYVEATTLEVLRYSSINPIAARSPNKDCFINDYFIPKDTVVGILLHSIHFNEKTWGDPLNFRPERFLNQNMEIINAEKIIPFGYGKRVCMGEHLARASFFTFFTILMQRYTFEKSPFHPEPSLEPRSGLTSTPEPFHVLIKSINGIHSTS